MAKIKIFTDTSSDIPEKLAEQYNIGILRFLSVFDDKSYVTGTEMTNERFYDMLTKSDSLPTTSQTPYADMYDAFLSSSREYDSVIYIAISSKGSGQSSTAQMVRNDILESDNPDADIRIIDSMKYSLFLTAAAVRAAKLAEDGADADDVVAAIEEELESYDVLLMVDDMTYLQKGGRISKATALLGSLLDIKPLLAIRGGLMENVGKLRGKKRLLEKLAQEMLDDEHFDDTQKCVMLVHSDKEKAEEMTQILENEGCGAPYITSEFGPIVGTHVGPGAIALIYKIKK